MIWESHGHRDGRGFQDQGIGKGKLLNLPVIDVMSRPVHSIEPEAFCFEAILSMISNRIKYLPVMDGLNLVGIISDHDLMVSQGNNPVPSSRISQAGALRRLSPYGRTIDRAMRVILEHGGRLGTFASSSPPSTTT